MGDVFSLQQLLTSKLRFACCCSVLLIKKAVRSFHISFAENAERKELKDWTSEFSKSRESVGRAGGRAARAEGINCPLAATASYSSGIKK